MFLLLVGVLNAAFFQEPWWVIVVVNVTLVYLLPPLATRLVYKFFGAPKKSSLIPSRSSLVWWFGCQMQTLFIRFPFFENILRMVPGLYSVWLRLWGAKIGKMVFCSGEVHILDRTHLVVDDNVLVGHGVNISSHTVYRDRRGQEKLVLDPVKIGARAVVGGRSLLGPRCNVRPDETVKINAVVSPFLKLF